ncbi:GDYXXLXY domain-containing protein [Rhizobium sp. SG2393]|uniref:GDYXXLXY domain-containing protein n=1 Tax=Rhizobium sp. SG2393 TaxID=3276279 RepID=UPI00366F0738
MTTAAPDPATRKPLLAPLLAALVVALLQTGIVGWAIAQRATILRQGDPVVLKTAPVDPRDLLRGDYVVLSYEIATIDSDRIVGPTPDATTPARLHVRIAPGADGFWTVSEASFEPLAKRPGSVILLTEPFAWYPPAPGTTSSYFVSYGIERYYVPEGEGRALEDAVIARSLAVTVRVSDAGTAQIAALSIDGKPVYDEPLF